MELYISVLCDKPQSFMAFSVKYCNFFFCSIVCGGWIVIMYYYGIVFVDFDINDGVI